MMKILLPVLVASCLAILANVADGQSKPTPLDEYIDSAKNIVIARCLTTGPVNILLRSRSECDVLLVIKGNETLRKLIVDSAVGIIPGERYLLRTVNEKDAEKLYFRIDSPDSAIQMVQSEEIDELKNLSPRIVVLRTLNLRIATLESEIKHRQNEFDVLAGIKKGN